MIWPNLICQSWSGDYEFPNTKPSMKISKDWAWKFKEKVCLKATNEVPIHVLELCKADILIGGVKEHVQELWIIII